MDDIIVFLAGFFAGNLVVADIAGLGGSHGPDNQITVDDLILFLSEFFSSTTLCQPHVYRCPAEEGGGDEGDGGGQGMRAGGSSSISAGEPVLSADVIVVLAAMLESFPAGAQRDTLTAVIASNTPQGFVEALQQFMSTPADR